jgi:hyperpolarization activated cyclic nucleotide-gated potassium channel 2
MVINFRLAYYDETSDAMVIISSKIAKNYLKGWFVPDLLSTIPFESAFDLFFNAGGETSYVRILKISRILRVFRLLRLPKFKVYIARIIDVLGISPWSLEMLGTMILFTLITHWIACAYWYLCTVLEGETWYDLLNLRDDFAGRQYLVTLYWTLTTTSTTGYGDIVPSNAKERVMAIFIMVIGATLYLYSVSRISELIGTFDVSSKKIQERIHEVEGYLSERNAPEHMVQIVTKHVRHRYANESIFDETAILSRLPSRLSRDLIMSYHKEHMQNICIFPYFPDREAKVYVFQKLTPVFYEVSEAIINQGFTPHGIAFLNAGKAEITRITRYVKRMEVAGQHDDESSLASQSLLARFQSIHAFLFPKKQSGDPHQIERSYTINAADFVKRPPSAILRQRNYSPIDTSLPSSLQVASNIRKFVESSADINGNKAQVTTFHVCVGLIEAGSMCGYGPLLTQGKAVASVIARSPCSVFLLPDEAINSMVVTEPEVARIVRNSLIDAIKRQLVLSKIFMRRERHTFIRNLISDFKAHRLAQRRSLDAQRPNASAEPPVGDEGKEGEEKAEAAVTSSPVEDGAVDPARPPGPHGVLKRKEKETSLTAPSASIRTRGVPDSEKRFGYEQNKPVSKWQSLLNSTLLGNADDGQPDFVRKVASLRRLQTFYDSDEDDEMAGTAPSSDSWGSRKLVLRRVGRHRALSFDEIEVMPFSRLELHLPSKQKGAESPQTIHTADVPKETAKSVMNEAQQGREVSMATGGVIENNSASTTIFNHLEPPLVAQDQESDESRSPMDPVGEAPTNAKTKTASESKFVMPDQWTSTWQLKPRNNYGNKQSPDSPQMPSAPAGRTAPRIHVRARSDGRSPEFPPAEPQPLIVQALRVPRFRRRLSFPSLDIERWREDKILRTLV